MFSLVMSRSASAIVEPFELEVAAVLRAGPFGRHVLLVRRRQRKAWLERVRVRDQVVRVVALGAHPVPFLIAVAHAPAVVLVLPVAARVHEVRHHARLAVPVCAAVEVLPKIVDPAARGVFMHLAVHRVPQPLVWWLRLRLGLLELVVACAWRLARFLRARLLAVVGLARLVRLTSQRLVA